MKNYRLFGIVYKLLSEDVITAKELADYFEVSIRTIYRDIDVLSSFNIPIYASKGKNGGIKLLDNYKLDKTLLSEEEQIHILLALQGLEKLSANNNENLFDKMQTVFNKKTKDWIDINFSTWGKDTVQTVNFNNIKQAIINEQRIEFTYYNSYGEKSKRIVEPLQICFKYNAWYVLTYEEKKQDYRLFKIIRINDLNILDETFSRELPKEKPYNEGNAKMITLELEILKEMAYRVYDEFTKESITITENGNFLIKVEYPESDWLYGYILSFGENIKVILPVDIKQKVREKLEKSIKNYL